MIGVISKEKQHHVIREFFQLFKTPWEFYDHERHYDVVISTGDNVSEIRARLLIIYCGEQTSFDSKNGIDIRAHKQHGVVECGAWHLPIYGKVINLSLIHI